MVGREKRHKFSKIPNVSYITIFSNILIFYNKYKNNKYFAVFQNKFFPVTDLKKQKNYKIPSRVFHALRDGIFGLSIRRNHIFFYS